MSAHIIVLPLVKSDIPAILAIEKQSQSEPWTEQSFLEEIGRPGSFMLVARVTPGGNRSLDDAAQIAGYICFWSVADEIQILNVAVRPDLRRRGIASSLLARAIEEGREKRARIVTLEVRQNNTPARRLYESFGFNAVAERPNYYELPPEPAILMELEIHIK